MIALIHSRVAYRLLGVLFALTLITWDMKAQSRLVINGGNIILNAGVTLVIENPDNSAITRINAGYIQSEQQDNRIVWKIGAGNNKTYIIPFGNSSNYFPLQYNVAAVIGSAGEFVLSTYPTLTWKNSDALPPGVINLNPGSGDSSAKIIDRFWQIRPLDYSNNPNLSNIIFTYNDNELLAPNNIAEQNLVGERWNPGTQSWNDYLPQSTVNTANNTLTVAAIPGSQLYDWWSLADIKSTSLEPSHVNFKALIIGVSVLTIWTTDFEHGVDRFEVWRSEDGIQFNNIGNVQAKDNGAVRNTYSLGDNSPYPGVSFYKLKIFLKDGSFKWSEFVVVNFGSNRTVSVFPNPASEFIIINSNADLLSQNPIARLYDAKGSLLKSLPLNAISQQLNIATLAKGIYIVRINYSYKVETLQFIKK